MRHDVEAAMATEEEDSVEENSEKGDCVFVY